MRAADPGSPEWICAELNISAWPHGERGDRMVLALCCVPGSPWWLPAQAALRLGSLLRFSQTSRSGSALHHGKGNSFSCLLSFEDRDLEDSQASSGHRNQAQTDTGVETGLFVWPRSPNSPCHCGWHHHNNVTLPAVLRSISPRPISCWCPSPECWLLASALHTLGHARGVEEL